MSFTEEIDEEFYKDSDHIYQEGFLIMTPKKSKKKTKYSKFLCNDKSQKEANNLQSEKK